MRCSPVWESNSAPDTKRADTGPFVGSGGPGVHGAHAGQDVGGVTGVVVGATSGITVVRVVPVTAKPAGGGSVGAGRTVGGTVGSIVVVGSIVLEADGVDVECDVDGDVEGASVVGGDVGLATVVAGTTLAEGTVVDGTTFVVDVVVRTTVVDVELVVVVGAAAVVVFETTAVVETTPVVAKTAFVVSDDTVDEVAPTATGGLKGSGSKVVDAVKSADRSTVVVVNSTSFARTFTFVGAFAVSVRR